MKACNEIRFGMKLSTTITEINEMLQNCHGFFINQTSLLGGYKGLSEIGLSDISRRSLFRQHEDNLYHYLSLEQVLKEFRERNFVAKCQKSSNRADGSYARNKHQSTIPFC